MITGGPESSLNMFTPNKEVTCLDTKNDTTTNQINQLTGLMRN